MTGFLTDASGYLLTGMTAYILYMLFYELFLFRNNREISWLSRISMLLLGIYLTIIFSVTVSPMYGFSGTIHWNQVNLIPGQVFRDKPINYLNLFGNILMFMPIGILAPLISRKLQRLFNISLLGMLISLGIETMQLFLGRGTDIDDLLLNTIGTVLGYSLFALLLSINPGLRIKTGITLKKNGKKRKKDSTPVTFLILIMLLTVIGTGAYKRNDYMQPGSNLTEALTAFTSKVSGKTAGSIGIVDTKDIEDIKDIKDGKADPITYEQAQNEEPFQNLQLLAGNVCLVNATKKQEIFSINSNEQIAPASTTKMLTAMTVLAFCELKEKVTVGEEINSVAQDASRAGVSVGNVFTVKQLLEGLLLPSGNDAAYVLAAYTGRKIAEDESLDATQAVELFVEKMNEKAVEIGAVNSNFVRPDGYDADGQYTTAYDLACIAGAFLKYDNGLLSDMVKKESVQESPLNASELTWENTNELINPASQYYYKEAIGIKTGSSDKAGKCLVSAARIHKNLYIAVVMGDTDAGRFEDSIALYEALK